MPRLVDAMARMVRGELPQPQAAQLLAMRLDSYADGEAVVVIDAGPTHTNPMGTVQGGILAAAADAAMGWAYMTTLGDGESYTTLELKTNFLRPVWAGRLTARGRVVNAGKSVGLVQCEIVDDRDRLVLFAVSTCLTLRGEQAAGR